MRISSVLKSGLVAVALASSFAMPAAAHGDVRYETFFFSSLGAAPIGAIIRYCDRHTFYWGEIDNPENFSESYSYDCPA